MLSILLFSALSTLNPSTDYQCELAELASLQIQSGQYVQAVQTLSTLHKEME